MATGHVVMRHCAVDGGWEDRGTEGKEFCMSRMSEMNVRPLKSAGMKDQRYMEERRESEWASCGDRRG
jgi:hypothetical protein